MISYGLVERSDLLLGAHVKRDGCLHMREESHSMFIIASIFC